jgi:hypothetical protein
MILLDTCVLSEPLRSQPDPRVLAWLDNQAAETLFLSSISCAELLFGVQRLPDGKRKSDLEPRVRRALALFDDRTLDFDREAAEHLARIAAHTEKAGRKPTAPDVWIAAIAAAHGFAVATRNIRHFEHTGVPLIDPWA